MKWGKATTQRRVPGLVRAVVGSGILAAGGIVVGRALASQGEMAAEARVVQWLRRHRTPRQDAVALTASWLTDVPRAVAGSALVVGTLRWRTKRTDIAIVPGVAAALASAVHVSTSMAVGRPRPGVERLGTQQMTSSYPSGHVGAVTAQSVVLAKLARDLPRPLRGAAVAVCAGYPLVVGWSRLYTGQHHVSDVLAGYGNGIVCGVLASALLPDAHSPVWPKAQ